MRAVIPSFAVIEIGIMADKSSVTADEEQRQELVALSHARDRGEADRARAILLTLSGWTSGQIAEAFGVREEIRRAGARSDQSRGRIGRGRGGSIRTRGGSSELDATTSGGRDRIARGCAHLTLAALGRAAPKGDFRWRRPRHTLKGRQDPDAVDRAGLRRKLLKPGRGG